MGEFDDTIKSIFHKIAERSHFSIEIMESDTDHAHFLVSYPPNISVTPIVRRLKQESTIRAWSLFEDYLKKDSGPKGLYGATDILFVR